MPVALEIVSPEKLLLSRPVDMVVIPSAEGEMGVLPNHAPMIVLLRGGVLRLYEGDKVTDRLFVADGFAEITPERCTVLAGEVLPLEDISAPTVQQRLAEAQAAYDEVDKNDIAAIDAAMERIQGMHALLEALGLI
jgi:F-type H+-transporting ATPase subunit epsilon